MTPSKPTEPEIPGRHSQRVHDYLRRFASAPARSEAAQAGPAEPGAAHLHAIIATLDELGPVFSLFRIYLSTRIDLFSDKERRELAAPAPHLDSPPFADLRPYVERQLGQPVEQVFLAVEPTPHETTLSTVSYLALLPGGENVSLTVLRPTFAIWPQEQIDALRLFCSARLGAHGGVFASGQVVAAFAEELHRQIDLYTLAAHIAVRAVDAAASDVLCAPMVYLQLCRPGLLVRESVSLVRLSAVIAEHVGSGESGAHPFLIEISLQRLARVLCTAWLREAFLAQSFPVYCGDLSVTPEGKVAFLNGPYLNLPPGSSEVVWKYLLAVAQDNPDECCRTLLLQTVGSAHEDTVRELIGQFRQAVPSFLAGPGDELVHSGTAARIQSHLDLIKKAGFQLLPSALDFYRGLFSLLASVRRLHPDQDPLLQAIEDVWLTGILGSFKQLMRIDALTEIGNKYVASFIEAPRTMNEALTILATGKRSEGEESPSGRSTQEARGSSALAALLLLAAILILVRTPSLHIPAWWASRISFVVCCLAGLLALRIASST